jgi:regulator of sigma D
LDTQIREWLAQRHNTWLLCTQFAQDHHHTHTITLKEVALFCQTLVDYVARGHFGVHEKLIHAALENKVSLDQQLLAHIDRTTDAVQAFNKKYTRPKHLKAWFKDLSQLSEHLAQRKECEQRLMQPYLDAIGIDLAH